MKNIGGRRRRRKKKRIFSQFNKKLSVFQGEIMAGR
jgi:hypothetical protein